DEEDVHHADAAREEAEEGDRDQDPAARLERVELAVLELSERPDEEVLRLGARMSPRQDAEQLGTERLQVGAAPHLHPRHRALARAPQALHAGLERHVEAPPGDARLVADRAEDADHAEALALDLQLFAERVGPPEELLRERRVEDRDALGARGFALRVEAARDELEGADLEEARPRRRDAAE